jgi:hypothetical protein
MGVPKATCPDCGTQLQAIKLVDATDNIGGEGSYRVNLTYAAQDAQAPMGGWLGGITPKGNVHGRICTQCGRILLYGVPLG